MTDECYFDNDPDSGREPEEIEAPESGITYSHTIPEEWTRGGNATRNLPAKYALARKALLRLSNGFGEFPDAFSMIKYASDVLKELD